MSRHTQESSSRATQTHRPCRHLRATREGEEHNTAGAVTPVDWAQSHTYPPWERSPSSNATHKVRPQFRQCHQTSASARNETETTPLSLTKTRYWTYTNTLPCRRSPKEFPKKSRSNHRKTRRTAREDMEENPEEARRKGETNAANVIKFAPQQDIRPRAKQQR